MKNIFLVFALLLFSLNCQAQNNQISNIDYKKYNVIYKIVQNTKGDVVSAQIIQSSNNSYIDKKILDDIKEKRFPIKTINFIEVTSSNNRNKERYLFMKTDISSQKINKQNEQMPTKLDIYITQFEKQVKKNWKPSLSKPYNVISMITLSNEGQLLNRSIVKSSGIKEADDAILKSIDAGTPYPKFPQETDIDTINIQYTFYYPYMSINE